MKRRRLGLANEDLGSSGNNSVKVYTSLSGPAEVCQVIEM